MGRELWQIKGALDKDLWELVLVNRPIKAARGVGRREEKLERLPTSGEAGASAGVAGSAVRQPAAETFIIPSCPLIKGHQSWRILPRLSDDFSNFSWCHQFVLKTFRPPLSV